MQSRGVKNFLLARTADLVSLLHVLIVLVAAFGWWIMPNHPFHLMVLIATLMSWLVTGSCILAQIEYQLRRHYLPTIAPYKNGYLHYHLHKLSGYAPSLSFIRTAGYIYLSLAIILWIADVIIETGMLA